MSASLDVLFLRRPKIDYVSPPVCEAIFSGSGSPVIVLDPFDLLDQITGIVIEVIGGSRIVSWPSFPGAICYTIYLEDNGELTVIAECVTDPTFPIPDDIEGSIVITPITPDGEGPISDPIELPPGGGGGGEECEEFIDPTIVQPSGNVERLNKISGSFVGFSVVDGQQRPFKYQDRVAGDLRVSISSGAVQASQSASDLVNTDGSNFFSPSHVGKFLKFTSGGDAREIIAFVNPTQVQVSVSDTVALSTFVVNGKTLGGASGLAYFATADGKIVGIEETPAADLRTFWLDETTGLIRNLGDAFAVTPIALNENGFLLFTDINTGESVIYNPNTETTTSMGNVSMFALNSSLLVTGQRNIDHFPAAVEIRAIKWQSGIQTDIHPTEAGTGAGKFSEGLRVIDSGLIIGRWFEPTNAAHRLFYHIAGVSTAIGFFHFDGDMDCNDINQAGMAVGSGDISAGLLDTRGFKWTVAGGLVQLGVLPGQLISSAASVNESGVIVGVCDGGASPRACIWLPGQTTPQDLNDYLPPSSGWILDSALGITNDNGVIVFGSFNGDVAYGFLQLCLDL